MFFSGSLMNPRVIGYILLILMLMFPAVPELLKVKAGLFALLIACTTGKCALTGRIELRPVILLAVLFYCAVGFIWAFEGAASSPAGAQKQAQIYAFWPLIYTVLAAGLASSKALVGMQRSLVIGAALLGISGVGFILSNFGLIPEYWFFNAFESQDQVVTFGEGLIEIRVAGLTSIAYLVPFMFASVLVYSREAFGMKKIWLWAALALQLALTLMSGKRALLIIIGIAPVIVLLLRQFLPTVMKSRSKWHTQKILLGILLIPTGLLYYLAAYHDFSPSRIPEMIAEGVSFTAGGSAYSRYQQFWALLNGWSEHPFMGAGHGTSVSYIRSDTMPWAYELFYLAILYQTGLVGFCLYAGGIIWIYWMGIRIIRQGGFLAPIALSNLAGMTGVLIANGTNPYLVRFDGLWGIFLSIAVINYWLLEQSSSGLRT